jgi:hypothetical protein
MRLVSVSARNGNWNNRKKNRNLQSEKSDNEEGLEGLLVQSIHHGDNSFMMWLVEVSILRCWVSSVFLGAFPKKFSSFSSFFTFHPQYFTGDQRGPKIERFVVEIFVRIFEGLFHFLQQYNRRSDGFE